MRILVDIITEVFLCIWKNTRTVEQNKKFERFIMLSW